jgi:uncharacterized protein YbjT (DUF2867 family)
MNSPGSSPQQATLHRRCPFSTIGIMNDATIVVAGATGNLGGRIASALLERGACVKALVRYGTAQDKLKRLRELGVTIASVDLNSASQVTPACSDASTVVSALHNAASWRSYDIEAGARLGDRLRAPAFVMGI